MKGVAITSEAATGGEKRGVWQCSIFFEKPCKGAFFENIKSQIVNIYIYIYIEIYVYCSYRNSLNRKISK